MLAQLLGRALPRAQRALGLAFVAYDAPAPPADSPIGAAPRVTWASGDAGARAEVQHAWLSELAVADPDAACERLGQWLVADVPGRGEAWVHGSDAGLRLLHWSLAVPKLGGALDPDLKRRMAGSAAAHVASLRAGLALLPDDHRRVLSAAGLVVGGLLFPGLPSARAAWSEGLSALGRALPVQVRSDGSPARGAPAHLARCVEACVVALASCEAAGVAPPASLGPALARAAWFLRGLRGGLPGLPPWGGPAPAGLPVDTSGLLPLQESMVPKKGWKMLSFRDGGWVALHGVVKGGPSRVLVSVDQAPRPWGHDDAGQLTWELSDGAVIGDPGALPGRPDLARAGAHCLLRSLDEHKVSMPKVSMPKLGAARVDGRQATVTLDAALGALQHERMIKVEGARLIVTDRFTGEGAQELTLRFPLGVGWSPEPEEKGGWAAVRGGRTLLIRPDEGAARWTWEHAEAVVEGRLEPTQVLVGRGLVGEGDRLRVRFEVR